jgi:hypothetical protein
MITVTGAYGAKYNNIVSAKDAWDRGKDFKIVGGSYINNKDWVLHLNKETVVFQGYTSTWILQEYVPV